MARTTRLTAAAVSNLSSPGQYSDGNGLTLKVELTGSKHWFQRVTINGRRRNIGLGGYPAVSLADARELASINQRIIKLGRDPLEEKRRAAEERRRPPCPTFAKATEEVISLRSPDWSNSKHKAQWQNSLSTYAFPYIGSKQVDEITSGDVLRILTPIWTSKRETASRVRQRIETVLDWTVAQGWRSDNPAVKSIAKALPRRPKTRKHHLALPYHDVAASLVAIRSSSARPATKLAIEFLVLTAARSGEVRHARWPEIDRRTRTWTIPAERMKARREHRVPLSNQALKVLTEAERLDSRDGELVFPAGRRGTPLSDMTFTSLLRRLDIPSVAHGYRSSFKDWVIEQTDTPWAVGEAALAHNLGNSTEQAYARSDLFEKRRSLMDEWASYLTTAT